MDAETLARHLDDPLWRLSNLYKVVTKGDAETADGDEGMVVTFKPNRAQKRLLARLHNRNIVLKARQLGFTTLVAILWLDTALFSKDPIRCVIVAQDRDAAEAILRGKILFAYDNLPEALRDRFPLSKRAAEELEFGHNGASIRVSTSARGATPHRLHVSEFGKISAKHPDKAKEVVTGSLPAVPKSGVIIIESTAEGRDGHFFEMAMLALAREQSGNPVRTKEYLLHFYPWWEAPEYRLDDDVPISPHFLRYFAEVEGKIGRVLTQDQRAWYVETVENEFNGDQSLMWQEFPSFPEEAFQVSTQGCYFATQLAIARKAGRVVERVPVVPGLPVYTFWDIGRGDMTAIWFMQKVGVEYRFIGYCEDSGEELARYAKEIQDRGHTYGVHFLPHEADYKRIGATAETNKTIKEMLEGLLPGQRFEVVTRTPTIEAGIQATREAFASCVFDSTACDKGLMRLGNYRKRWNKAMGCWSSEPMHDENSHGADAFRQFAQKLSAGETFGNAFAAASASASGFKRRGRSGMAV